MPLDDPLNFQRHYNLKKSAHEPTVIEEHLPHMGLHAPYPKRFHKHELRDVPCKDRQLDAVMILIEAEHGALTTEYIFDQLKGSESFGLWSIQQFYKRLLTWIKAGSIAAMNYNGSVYVFKPL